MPLVGLARSLWLDLPAGLRPGEDGAADEERRLLRVGSRWLALGRVPAPPEALAVRDE